MSEVKGLDRPRICGFISINDQRQQQGKIEKNHDYLTRLKRERFGNVIGQHSNIFNIAEINLSSLEREVLSRGLDFGIPKRTSREEIQTEFEVLYKQLKHYGPTSVEADDICRTKLAGIAEQFHGTPNNLAGFSLRKEHFKTIKSLRNNPEIVITRPDKGKGVVILRRKDYIDKMTTILNDTSKFTRLGPCTSHDSTARIERSLQDMLRELKKKGEISDEIYKRIRPTGSIRARMYGVPNVQKAGVPMRPILSMHDPIPATRNCKMVSGAASTGVV